MTGARTAGSSRLEVRHSDRIGYLVPEFPGQTHSFFWREIRALEALGVEVDVVSTRRPPPAIVSHSWAAEAIARTTYLTPVCAADLGRAAGELARAGPAAWARCLRTVLAAEGMGALGRLRLLALAALGGRLVQLARSRGWRHVHVHLSADAAHVAMFAHLLSGLPYSITLHCAIADNGPNQKEKWRHVAFGVTVNSRLVRELETALGSWLPQRMAVAPMGVEVERFTRGSPYRTWHPGGGPCRIFSCGRLNPAKGHADVVRAVGLLLRRGVPVRLDVAGDEHHAVYRKELEALIDAERIRDHVSLLGAVSEERVRECLESAHLFVLASRNEALGVATMEAMAMEVPVIVTDVGGVSELVSDGIDGTLVPPGVPEALATAIQSVLANPAQALGMAASARRKVASEFHSGRSAEVLAQLVCSTVPWTGWRPRR